MLETIRRGATVHKCCHVSIDDVFSCFNNIIDNANKWSTIFNDPFLGYLQKLHKKYGCCFTLYAYKQRGGVDISLMPQIYRTEFQTNSTWLKIGFHGIQPVQTAPRDLSVEIFKTNYYAFKSSVIDFAGVESLASVLRLDFFYATQEIVRFLRNEGVTVLLAADDERISYGLPAAENELLLKHHYLEYNGMNYLSTNVRIEKIIVPPISLFNNIYENPLVVFTHEWILGRVNRWKLEWLLWLLKKLHYKQICQ